jgi:opacity protein-like surface antigen
MRDWVLALGVVLVSVTLVAAQDTNPCEETLTQATDEFNAGRFYGVPAMLAPCIQRGFSREQLQRAYLLLTQTYLLLDDPLGAENSYLEVLRANPEFETDPVRDPIDVVYLSKKFTASPIFSLFGRLGTNVAVVRVIDEIQITSGVSPVNTNYILRPGWHLSLGVDWNYTKNVAITTELGLAATPYRKKQNGLFGRDQLQFTDRLTWVSIPVSVKYSFDRFYKGGVRRFIPHAFAGLGFQYLVSDNGLIESFNDDATDNGISTQIAESPNLNFLPYRNRTNLSFLLGGGARYKWKLDYLFAEIRYGFGMKNVVGDKTTFEGSGPSVEYPHVDDYFRLDNLSVSVGFVRPLYKPRKLKHAKTKSVLKEVKKGEL